MRKDIMEYNSSNEPSPKHDDQNDAYEVEPSRDEQIGQISRKSGILNVIVSGLALFSDGYNAQNSESGLVDLSQLLRI